MGFPAWRHESSRGSGTIYSQFYLIRESRQVFSFLVPPIWGNMADKKLSTDSQDVAEVSNVTCVVAEVKGDVVVKEPKNEAAVTDQPKAAEEGLAAG